MPELFFSFLPISQRYTADFTVLVDHSEADKMSLGCNLLSNERKKNFEEPNFEDGVERIAIMLYP